MTKTFKSNPIFNDVLFSELHAYLDFTYMTLFVGSGLVCQEKESGRLG